MPTQSDSRLRADERRFYRVFLLAAACSSTRSRELDFASTECLVLWITRRRDIHMSRVLRSRMLSKTFHLEGMTNYDVLSQMRFTKKHILDIASLIPWRETTILGQVRTARRRYCASKEEALCVLLARLPMPSRVEDLGKSFSLQGSHYRDILRGTGVFSTMGRTIGIYVPSRLSTNEGRILLFQYFRKI
jgi:hypothetical protein